MRALIKYFFIALVAASFLTCKKPAITKSESCAFDASVYQSHLKAAKFQALLDKYTAKGLPGINLLVRDKSGTWIGCSGMADIQNNVPMTPCIISKAASVTKLFISTLTMLMVEEGKLSLDDAASKWLPDYDVKDIVNLDKVTVRQLLNHTTGIYDVITDSKFYLKVLNNPNRDWNSEELLDFVKGKPAYFDPGTQASYSNTNYLLLGMILDKACGKPHDQLLKEKILEPLHLDNTFYHWHMPLPEGKVAQGYFDLYNNGTIVNMSNFNTGSGNGYGGMYSTVYDLSKFIDALLRDKTILKKSSLEEMEQFATTIENRKYLGVGIFKDFIDFGDINYAYGHRGRDLGYSADLFYFPEREITLALMVNYGTDANSSLRQVFLDFRDELTTLILE